MKTISIRELHAKTGEWVRLASRYGEVLITDRGKTVAKIIPQVEENPVPYFARRIPSPEFAAIMDRLTGGTDSTDQISSDRDAR